MSNQHLTVYFEKKLEKVEQAKLKASQRKETKIIMEINKVETGKITEKIIKTKNQLFEKLKKIKSF